MAALQASGLLSSSSIPSAPCHGRFVAVLHAPKLWKNHLSFPKLPIGNVEEFNTHIRNPLQIKIETQRTAIERSDGDMIANVTKLYAIAEAVADRVEMHMNIGEQRNNWNNLLVNSINGITLTAATMAGLSAIPTGTTSLLALKISSALLNSAATGLLLLVNKIQPSQLAEEQRNAARLFRQLHTEIQTTLALRTPTPMDVKDVMERVLALDKAYPLPLLPGMLEKFPATVEPARWWPSNNSESSESQKVPAQNNTNGWSGKLEDEMRGVLEVLRRKDTAEYVRLSKFVLKVNRILAVSGPLLTGLAALGTSFVGSPSHGSWAVLVGVAGGGLASIVNTLEHGGQVGMVFEMYRNCAGFYRLLEESIESNLKERETHKRENGELFEMKVALQLGRSLSELRNLAASSSSKNIVEGGMAEFAGKLF
ncbi:probable F-box protein At4g22030 [Magnolia sinica]|uniref:probable F-box protein At4g22030 n=1 Tax=Magnolia sinica TaxID=86752 RepID=UPI00265A73AD|nr:probable F-box protein At4g22030 [Magnolia sinica]